MTGLDTIGEIEHLLGRAGRATDPNTVRVLVAEARIQARAAGERLQAIALTLETIARDFDGAGAIG